MNQHDKGFSLGDLRILDLTDQKGVYCSKLLADLGADVIKIEPPGGDQTRKIGPFYKGIPHPERSLFWYHFNTNKRSITLNLDCIEGRNILKSLIRRVDILIESYPQGYLDEIGMGYSILKELNPRLILTSISCFGDSGPWKDYKSSDLIASALGGLLSICGWPDLPPLRMAGSQSYHQVGMQAAVGTLIALFQRDLSDEGQHVDVSMHQSIPLFLMHQVPRYAATGEVIKRAGDDHSMAASGIFPCKDGYVDFRVWDRNWKALVQWLDSEGMAGDFKKDKWGDPLFRRRPAAKEHIDFVFRTFLLQHPMMYLYEEGQRRGFEVGAVYTAENLVNDPQLTARNYFVNVEHPELGANLHYLGAPFRLSETPWQIRRRAPLIGEHNVEIYEQELGYSRQDINDLKHAGII